MLIYTSGLTCFDASRDRGAGNCAQMQGMPGRAASSHGKIGSMTQL
jgi:hypothetical protein